MSLLQTLRRKVLGMYNFICKLKGVRVYLRERENERERSGGGVRGNNC